MAHVPTMLGQAVGRSLAGQLAPNKTEDVNKVQALLRKVLGSTAPVMLPGACDLNMQRAILDFQQRWSDAADGVVDPHGQTLKRLDRLATPLDLRPIALSRVLAATKDGRTVNDGGGYSIAVRTCDGGPLPPVGRGYVLYLAILNDNQTVDVTGRPLHDLMCVDNLGDLLNAFDRLHCWGTPVQCRAQVRLRGEVISSSAAQTLNAPVLPHNGQLLPLDEAGNGPRLSYQGDPEAKDFHGRMFVQVPGFKKCLFVYAGQFELLGGNRGFDCITYAGTACGAANTHMADAEDLADSLGALSLSLPLKHTDPKTGRETSTVVSLDEADPAHVKAFFAGNTAGYYLMWSSGHVVLVANGEVHEFKASAPSGYARTPVATWLQPYKTKKLTVRKLPDKPARAA